MHPCIETILTRHAVRRFQERQVEEDTLQEILTAGLYAPSAGNNQHSRIVVCQDREINQKLGITVVVITHQMSVIEEICSRVAILDGGVMAEQGKVEDIFSNPHTDAARRLVYPGGVSLEQYPAGTHAVRVAFNGGTAYQPLIASLAIDLGVKVNILGADTRNIEGRAFGTMLLGLPDDPNEAAKALSYIRAQPNVSAEEVEYHV